MAQEQPLDPAVRTIIDDITRPNSSHEAIMFALHNYVLYRHNFHPDGSSRLLVIPKHLRSNIL